MKTKCIIVDDEPLAIKLLKSHVEKVESLELVAECRNAMQAFDALRTKSVDLMFTDIQMPQMTGIDFLKSLSHPPKVIITTAYREYAIEGFELEVVDYLLKPIQFDRFFKAVNRYFQLVENEIKVFSEDPGEGQKNKKPYVYVKENKKVVKIYLHDIYYIEGLGEYIKIFTPDATIITKSSLTNVEEKLPSDMFVRTHRSFIANLTHVKAFSSVAIEVKDKKIEIPIGRTYKNEVLKALKYESDML